MHVAFGRVRRKSRIGADSTDAADYRMGDGGRRLDRSKRFICRIGERAIMHVAFGRVRRRIARLRTGGQPPESPLSGGQDF